jgi:hypothetical protein
MGTDKVVFEGEQWGATGSDMTGSDVSHVTRSDVSHVTRSDVSHVTGRDPVRKYTMRMRNRKLYHVRPSRVFWPEVTKSRDRKGTCPEVALTGSRFCACPAFSGAFFLVVVPWLPDVTKGHLTPSEFPWVCATRSCATPVVVVNNAGWGVLYDVRILYLAGLLELNTCVLYLVTGTSPGYLPLLFSYSVYIGCIVLLLC